MSTTNHPTELARSSKEKFVLGQARLRRGHIELTLLSVYASLDDGLRSYLLLHGRPVASDDWPSLIGLLRADEELPLTRPEADTLERIYSLWLRIIHGESVTLTLESIQEYQQLASTLLLRYGVLVVAPETSRPLSDPAMLSSLEIDAGRRWQRWRPALNLLLVLVVILFVGVGGILVFTSDFASGDSPRQPASTGTSQPTDALSPAPPEDTLAPGRTAFVRASLEDDVALRASPGSDNRVVVYIGPDTAVRIIEGPVQEDSSEWWKVQALNQEGWCRADVLEVR